MSSQPGGRFEATNITLRHLIAGAYGTPQQPVPDSRIIGGPNWMDSDRFDVAAKAAGNPDRTQMLLMVRALLAERFKLSVHHESRELPIYALVMARADRRLGLQLHRSEVEDCNAQAVCGIMSPAGPPHLMGKSVGMASVATALARFAGRAVEDRTGLIGNYDFDLRWSLDQMQRNPQVPAPAPPADGPSIFTALQEQLGLKLEAAKAALDVVVIDRAEPPTEN